MHPTAPGCHWLRQCRRGRVPDTERAPVYNSSPRTSDGRCRGVTEGRANQKTQKSFPRTPQCAGTQNTGTRPFSRRGQAARPARPRHRVVSPHNPRAPLGACGENQSTFVKQKPKLRFPAQPRARSRGAAGKPPTPRGSRGLVKLIAVILGRAWSKRKRRRVGVRAGSHERMVVSRHSHTPRVNSFRLLRA